MNERTCPSELSNPSARAHAGRILAAANKSEFNAACDQVPEHLQPTVREMVAIGKALRNNARRAAKSRGRLR